MNILKFLKKNKSCISNASVTEQENYKPEYFMTYQPKEVVDILRESDYKPKTTNYDILKEEIGYMPIFLIPLINKPDLYVRNFFSTPSKPEYLIITKVTSYACIDAAEWYRVKGGAKKSTSFLINEDSDKEIEYITSVLKKDMIQEIIPVDKYAQDDCFKTINRDVVQDCIFTRLIPYSTHFWRDVKRYLIDSSGISMKWFLESEEYQQLERGMMIKMSTALQEHTEDDVMQNYMTKFRSGIIKAFKDK